MTLFEAMQNNSTLHFDSKFVSVDMGSLHYMVRKMNSISRITEIVVENSDVVYDVNQD